MTKDRPLRIIQWATGNVGRRAIAAIAEDPSLELVGVWVHDEAKDGVDAGEIAGIGPLGVAATRDANALLALDADCVLYAPLLADVDEMCRLLAVGKNIVTPAGFSFVRSPDLDARLDAACRAGGVSFHGSGLHPGFVGDRLPLVLSALCRRVDKITVHEICDLSRSSWGPELVMGQLGFGLSAEDAAREPPAPMGGTDTILFESMDMVAAGLGFEIDGYEYRYEFAPARHDVSTHAGPIRKGHVAGQHFEYTGLSNGRPVIQFQTYWKMTEDLDPGWPVGHAAVEYIVEVDGDPSMRCNLAPIDVDQSESVLSTWTVMNCVNALRPVCAASPGICSALDLPLLRAEGRFRLP